MANEKVNKVVLGNETLIDLTSDTVTANNLLSGATAHDASGERIQGNVSVPTVLDDLSDVNAGSPTSGDVLFNDGTEWINKNITRVVTKAQYDALVQAGTVDPDVNYFVTDMGVTGVPLDDSAISANKVWSSQRTNNAIKTTKLTVTVQNWTSDTTSQSGTTLYKKQILVNHIYVDCPTVDIGQPITVPLPTVDNQKAYNLLQYVTFDDTVPCLYLYGSAIPTSAYYINVRGVD